jgi:hypothetical protein
VTNEEVAKVLARIQLGDNRQVDRATLAAWIDEIGDLDFRDAVEAVRLHRQESPHYLMAAHVRANVRVIQRQRERAERVAQPRAVEPNVITLDREKFEQETAYWAEYYRQHPEER